MSRKQVDTQHLVVLVNKMQLPMAEVERQTGLTRQGIWKRLKAAGYYVPRAKVGGAPRKYLTVNCAFCLREIRRRVKLASKVMHNFCGEECYYAQLASAGYNPWRQGCRIARALVAMYFPLQRQHVVHHKDGDNRNNDRANLMVFATQADHLAHHRGRTIAPLWDGAF